MVQRLTVTRALVGKTVAALALAGAGALLAAPGASATNGNTVNNCFGAYYTTSWHQYCHTGGAAAIGQ
ncbi:hypothetical protein [Streptomyces sp. KMM 9044]|uniref:hypothetical protein n=1 Tax=Streptomyces sp. KMM 9044 TaxID=2744474 RepID=UPI002151C1A2|nr:hypothetical protein [Streptomyces sp. KMM 9044]WAX81265.1 hypothetical protein HUV60_030045 [Streptomyces sp. KMM 9044]